ncbi:MAG: LON peptidase substrate-binding domain-containing protein, partial [Gemmatimonadaceae bacterium]
MTTSKPRPSIVHGESHSYPVLPLRDIVVFPHNIVPLFVGREKSIRALEEVMKNDALVMLATQKNASDDDPTPDAIYETGTLACVLQLLKLPDGTVKVLVEGNARARIKSFVDNPRFFQVQAEMLPEGEG